MIEIAKNCMKLGGRLSHEFVFFDKIFYIDLLNKLQCYVFNKYVST